MEKKEKKKIVIRTIIKFLMIGLVTYIFIRCLMISGDTTVKEIDGDAMTVVSGEEYHYAFDGVRTYETTRSNGENWVYVHGWFFEDGNPTFLRTFNVVLKDNETGKYYSLPTMMEVRKDVTAFVDDGLNYDQAGFISHLPVESLFHGEYYDFDICFMVTYDEQSVLFDTGRNLGELAAAQKIKDEEERLKYESTEEVDDEEVDDGE